METTQQNVKNRIILEVMIRRFRYAGANRDSLKNTKIVVHRGETIVFLGDSGSGKSTLLRCIGGLCPYLIFGKIEGKIIFHLPCLKMRLTNENYSKVYERLGFLFQNPEAQIINQTVLDELVFTLENQGISKIEIQSRLDFLLSLFPVKHLFNRQVKTLSQGQKQLIALLSVLLQKPDILLLDEPTAMLDIDNTTRFVGYLKKLKEKQNCTILLTTHKKEIARELGDRIFYLKDGELVSPDTRSIAPFRYKATILNYPKEQKEESLLALNNISYWYNPSELILKDVNLKFYQGEFIWIAGSNGSGKSTLALIMSGLLKSKKGIITFNGANIQKRQDLYPGEIGVVFQNPDHQIFSTTVMEELSFGLQFLTNLSEDEKKQRVFSSVKSLHFLNNNISNTDPRELSFGQKKILNILSFLIAQPKVLILDEPDLALDEKHEQKMIQLLKEMQKKETLIIIISHNEGLIHKYATRLIYLKNNIAYDGHPDNFFKVHNKYAAFEKNSSYL